MTVNELLILIPAVTAAVVSIINTLKAKGRDEKLDLNTELTAQTKDTTSKIQSLVNGQSEALKQALVAAQERVRVLEAELATLKGQP
jgi:hypothetical protein